MSDVNFEPYGEDYGDRQLDPAPAAGASRRRAPGQAAGRPEPRGCAPQPEKHTEEQVEVAVAAGLTDVA